MNYEERYFTEEDYIEENNYKITVDFRKISPKGVRAEKVLCALKKYLKTFNKK